MFNKIILLTCILMSSKSLAGAWTLPQGKGLAIIELEYSKELQHYNTSEGRYKKEEINIYNQQERLYNKIHIEKGISDDFTAGFISRSYYDISHKNIEVNRKKLYLDGNLNRSNKQLGFQYLNIFGRKRFWHNDYQLLSLEPSLEYNNSLKDFKVGIKGLYGISWLHNNLYHFISLEPSYIKEFKKASDEYKIDATIGYKYNPKVLYLFQLSANMNSYKKYKPDYKVQISTVTQISNKLSLQIGAYNYLNKKNDYYSQGIILGLWIDF